MITTSVIVPISLANNVENKMSAPEPISINNLIRATQEGAHRQILNFKRKTKHSLNTISQNIVNGNFY